MDDQLLSWLESKPPVHIIGGGGVGMSGLAILLSHLGFEVSASDIQESVYLNKIADAGGRIWTGSSPEQVKPGAAVFFSSAVPPTDPERYMLGKEGWQVMNRFLLLSFISSQFYTIAVSGTHGKTTSSAMLAVTLEQLGADPTALIGGTVSAWSSHVRLGSGVYDGKKLLVLEADESDGSFNYIQADMGIITNIELDHTDRYATLQEVEAEFEQFASGIYNKGGTTVYSPGLDLSPSIKQLSLESALLPNATELAVPGAHNRENGANVIEAVVRLGYSRREALECLLEFNGVDRRLQPLQTFEYYQKQITIFDDYAHHPTELKAVYEALSEKYDQVLLIWEPHRPSRIQSLVQDFQRVIQSTYGYENSVRLRIYAASESGKDKELEDSLDFIRLVNTTEEAVSFINERMEQSDKIDWAILIAGAGDSSQFAAGVKDLFIERGR